MICTRENQKGPGNNRRGQPLIRDKINTEDPTRQKRRPNRRCSAKPLSREGMKGQTKEHIGCTKEVAMRSLLLIIFYAIVTATTSFADECVPDVGWYIKFCKVEADGVKLWAGIGGDSSSHRYWRRWDHTQPQVIPFPTQLKHVKEIWIQVEPDPHKQIDLCVGFDGHWVKKLSLDGSPEEYEKSRDDNDNCGC